MVQKPTTSGLQHSDANQTQKYFIQLLYVLSDVKNGFTVVLYNETKILTKALCSTFF